MTHLLAVSGGNVAFVLAAASPLLRRPRLSRRAPAAFDDFIGEKLSAHDFDTIEFDAEEFDRRLGTPGLHKVGRRVESQGRKTVLPGDLWRKYENDAFWRDPARNPNKVRVV